MSASKLKSGCECEIVCARGWKGVWFERERGGEAEWYCGLNCCVGWWVEDDVVVESIVGLCCGRKFSAVGNPEVVAGCWDWRARGMLAPCRAC